MTGLGDTTPPLTQDQKNFIILAQMLDRQKRAEMHVAFAGAVGLGLLGATAYLIWRRK